MALHPPQERGLAHPPLPQELYRLAAFQSSEDLFPLLPSAEETGVGGDRGTGDEGGRSVVSRSDSSQRSKRQPASASSAGQLPRLWELVSLSNRRARGRLPGQPKEEPIGVDAGVGNNDRIETRLQALQVLGVTRL